MNGRQFLYIVLLIAIAAGAGLVGAVGVGRLFTVTCFHSQHLFLRPTLSCLRLSQPSQRHATSIASVPTRSVPTGVRTQPAVSLNASTVEIETAITHAVERWARRW